MDKAAVLKILEGFRSAIERRGIRVEKLVLYGSYAHGTWHEFSDIDLIVISESFSSMGYWERIKVVSEAVCDVWEPIEAIAMTPQEWESGESMIAQFAKDGEVVYQAA